MLPGRKADYFNNTFKQLAVLSYGKCRWYKPNKFLIYEFCITSARTGKKYKLCLNYERGWPPRVWVVEPDLLSVPSLPHVYANEGNCLCLYKRGDFYWSADKNIQNTILYWAACWVEFYELWLECGVWLGTEAEHSPPKDLHGDKGQHIAKKTRKAEFLNNKPIRL